jgi:hypothetical protein
VDHSEDVSKFGWLFYLLEDGTQVGTIHEAAVLFGGSLRIKKPTRQRFALVGFPDGSANQEIAPRFE